MSGSFDADERFVGQDRYTLCDVTRKTPDLDPFGMIVLDPPFLIGACNLAPLLRPARKRPLIISATDWCVTKAGWGKLFARYGLAQVTSYFPRYRSIANGYCEAGLKRDGRTNISFYSNIPFAPPRRSVIIRREDQWITHDAYDFWEREHHDAPPDVTADVQSSADRYSARAKAIEIEANWDKMQRAKRVPWRLRILRLLRLAP